mmetsp:Transcript_12665/g.27418  ORF Transcript_12665/g.27418 Transcript_12665/m.27418 type:complete len:273 (+) Transcript_12665:433-1251(+)|eukprot:CAMPEP_0202906876 /NCGR_PEP_ID=MMETSP1392-20130828/40573_1 /ASSEMBLY_ACC=CAM_ASM_000868 /TAXON_ID=225041 /ORGANISM="Chlamydomonas chlamydogama, Strain SAG 11-48b" /LENGTH=272 /DNA_ID=CAMNT_0049595555 /DNA_START=424 /DNA_END=1242 /DNA_ORIENTATION=-
MACECQHRESSQHQEAIKQYQQQLFKMFKEGVKCYKQLYRQRRNLHAAQEKSALLVPGVELHKPVACSACICALPPHVSGVHKHCSTSRAGSPKSCRSHVPYATCPFTTFVDHTTPHVMCRSYPSMYMTPPSDKKSTLPPLSAWPRSVTPLPSVMSPQHLLLHPLRQHGQVPHLPGLGLRCNQIHQPNHRAEASCHDEGDTQEHVVTTQPVGGCQHNRLLPIKLVGVVLVGDLDPESVPSPQILIPDLAPHLAELGQRCQPHPHDEALILAN